MDTNTVGHGVGTFFAVVTGLIGVAILVLIIAAIISILMYGDLTGGGKLLWIIGVIWLPVVGSVAWFVVGKKGRLNEVLGIDRHSGPTPPPASAVPT